MRYWSCAPHTSLLQTTTYLHGMLASPANGSLDFVLVLVSPSSPTDPDSDPPRGKVIGKAGIWSLSNSEIGFLLHRDVWGEGYMAEALTALLGPNGVFWKRGVEGVVADVDPRNEGSMGILRRFGFVETGREDRTFETHLGWCDSVYLELRGRLAKQES
ncbi:hypothetical protein HO173_011078 [Letharia columbiana]|uniref:N-acetyltransferase domain-containing protein n=1 Tax=Letharia columbiana TaxID=112416 RepID=A0A8H6FLH1_9LECA|nr:uncharacterized protein HO173_011078 [Letharia columbiana]KAF6230726.1 hypothetical protein HO173_011078 [Letharia columbiana]